ncbi:hypothetical protein HII31_02765 [Pseudocercospora fuligena]|uniref:Uncharacterized protein n=1 Tax=Pseudocercospora fuligena TaxID=685502 RepID=A0A8H6RQ20_9PEZI|nr:hypothetical protein HII31_02765 [Pseudocercospora fuligena]
MCPPGVDQTTRTAQRWNILVPTLEQKQELLLEPGYEHRYTLTQEFLEEQWSFNAFERLFVQPKTNKNERVKPCVIDAVNEAMRSTKQSPFELLPTEMFHVVLNEGCLDKEDIVALGCCSTTTWDMVKPYIVADCKRNRVSWAGKPLLCSGTWLTKPPPALFELFPEQKEKENEWKTGPRQHWRGYGPGMCPARRWNWGAISSLQNVQNFDATQQWMSAITAWSQKGVKQSDLIKKDLTRALQTSLGYRSGHWILRNYTLKIYVGVETAIANDGIVRATILGRRDLSLDMALLIRICWGDTPLRDDENALAGFGKGIWAGHCFDVVLAGEPDCDTNFRDVTKALIRNVESVFKILR